MKKAETPKGLIFSVELVNKLIMTTTRPKPTYVLDTSVRDGIYVPEK